MTNGIDIKMNKKQLEAEALEFKRAWYTAYIQDMVRKMNEAGLTVTIENKPVKIGSSQMRQVVDVRPSRGYY